MRLWLVRHNRMRYLAVHWYDVGIVVLSVLPYFRPLRILRSARALRVLRAARVIVYATSFWHIVVRLWGGLVGKSGTPVGRACREEWYACGEGLSGRVVRLWGGLVGKSGAPVGRACREEWYACGEGLSGRVVRLWGGLVGKSGTPVGRACREEWYACGEGLSGRVVRLWGGLVGKSGTPVGRACREEWYACGEGLSGRVVVVVIPAIVAAGAGGVWIVEKDGNGAIDSYDDAAWWAVTTVTTVGYGDIAPVTVEGRLIAAVLMVTGIAVFGVATANIAAAMTTKRETPTDVDARIDELLAALNELKQQRP